MICPFESIGLTPGRKYTVAQIEHTYARAWKNLRFEETRKDAQMPLYRGGSAEKQKADREAREAAMTPALIRQIMQHPQMTQADRARMLQISRHSVARIMGDLKRDGVIAMEKSAEGRHIWRVCDVVG